MKSINLGTGVLTWGRSERVSDRYGAVYLIPDGANSLTSGPSTSLIDQEEAVALTGFHGKLIAKVIETRESTHIGDLFRGIGPRTPKKGSRLTLGEGTLFVEPAPDSGVAVGLRPDDGRASDWLKPRALYDAHEQTVELLFQPG